MLAPIDRPVVCPVMIGREPNLALLDDILAAVSNGEGQTVLLAGEAGVGKSRLVSEAKMRAARHGLLILQGNCFDTARSLPYAAILDMLRSFLATESNDRIALRWAPYAQELVKLLPELQAHIPGLTPTPPLDPEQEKRRLFDSICAFLNALALARPLLVVIEDLHWTDDIGLDFLLYMARRVAQKSVLLLITYRSDEARPLSHFLATLDRERLSSEMRLGRLPVNDVDLMIRTIFDLKRPMRGEFLEAIYSLTEGNAFFIEEVLKSLTVTGEIFYVDGAWERKPMHELHIPRSVQDAVQRRAEILSAEARHALALAAVVGRRFDFALLESLTGYDERALLSVIKELMSAQLVVEESVDRFAFRHALTRQAIYSDLLARERKSLHRTIAETMLRIYAGSLDSYVADLADHCFEAGMWSEALEYSRRAGENARVLYSPGAAVEQFTRAIEAAAKLGSEPPASLYRSRGPEYEMLGEFDLALGDYEAALVASRKEGDPRGEWEALLDLGKLWAGRDYGEAGEYFQQALDLARTLDDPEALGHSLNRMGNWHANIDQPHDAISFHEEALDIFDALDDSSQARRGTAESVDLLGMTTYISGDLRAGSAYNERAIELFTELNDKYGLCSSLAMLPLRGATHYHFDTLENASPRQIDDLKRCLQALDIARDIGWKAGEAFSLLMLGFTFAARGDYGLALGYADTGLSVATEIEHSQWIVGTGGLLGAIYVDIFSLNRAREILERMVVLASEIGSYVWIRVVSSFLATCCIAQGDHVRAEEVLDVVVPPDLPLRTIGQRSCWQARAEFALARDDCQTALEIVDRLYPNVQLAGSKPNVNIPRLGLIRGQALMGLGLFDEAEKWLVGALEEAQDLLSLSLVWRIYLMLGKLYSSMSRPEEAERSFGAARVLVDQLASTLPNEELRASYLDATTRLFPQKPSALPPSSGSSSRQSTSKAPGGLTSRELEVAMLVAQGKTNREIADALVLGERTIETHVGNALSKLGFTSRVQIAAWAVENAKRER